MKWFLNPEKIVIKNLQRWWIKYKMLYFSSYSLNIVNLSFLTRQYEERELRATQERDKKRLEFENQKNRIINRLEYERSKDTNGNFIFFILKYK